MISPVAQSITRTPALDLMDASRSPRSVMDVRDLVANYRWDDVADPPAGSGSMKHLDGEPMSDTEIEQWWSDRLRARRQS